MNKVRIANYILALTTIIASVLSIIILSWGLINRPLGTLAFISGAIFLAAFVWAFIVVGMEE